MAEIPVDFQAVLEEALNLKDASSTPVSVSVFLDDLAPEDVVACVRNAFASAASHARITLSYLGSTQAIPNAEDDMSVVVAGLSPEVGRLAADIRAAGVPTMVVTSLPQYVAKLAEEQGYPIPVGDLLAPVGLPGEDSPADRFVGEVRAQEEAAEAAARKIAVEEPAVPAVEVELEAMAEESSPENAPLTKEDAAKRVGTLLSGFASRAKAKVTAVSEAAAANAAQKEAPKTIAQMIAEAMPEGSPEPYVMTDEAIAALHKRMGEWIIDACKEKKLALALAFPFVRRPLSLEAVNVTSIQNAGIGAVLFIPGADMPIMTLNQVKMLLQIAAAYGQPMTADRIKELVAVVAGGFACRSVARELVGLVPMAGFVIKAGIGYTATLAMGRTAIEYFENGGGAVGVASLVGKAKDAATVAVSKVMEVTADEPVVDNRTSTQKAADIAKAWTGRLGKVATATAQVAGPVAQSAAKTGVSGLLGGSKSVLGNLTKTVLRP